MTSSTLTDPPQDEAVQPARLSAVFFITPNVNTLRKFYEGLGWRSARSDDLFVPFALEGGAFALFDEATAGGHLEHVHAAGLDFKNVGLCTVVDTPDEVDGAATAAERAGGRVVAEPTSTAYGRATWIADPADNVWEICWIDGKTSDAPFAGGPESDALVPRLTGVTLLAADVAPLRKFYEDGLGWSASSPSDYAGALDLDIAGIAVSFREAGPDVAALQASGAEVTGVVFTVPVSPEELDAAAAQLVERGATEVSSADEPRTTYLADAAGLIWKLQVVG